jgi:hypothetical protein
MAATADAAATIVLAVPAKSGRSPGLTNASAKTNSNTADNADGERLTRVYMPDSVMRSRTGRARLDLTPRLIAVDSDHHSGAIALSRQASYKIVTGSVSSGGGGYALDRSPCAVRYFSSN